MFTSIDSNARAYGLLAHRHTPEMEQEIGAQVLFTPHHVPMSRGLLAHVLRTTDFLGNG